ncbi:importin-alpha export receptor, partial [Rhizophlyctis rosea]
AIHPIIKVDAIKYLILFRSQLDKQQLSQIFPALLKHLGSADYVVYTYSAICIERILAMKVTDPASGRATLMLFNLIELGRTPEKIAENDYLMKTVMRLIAITREDTLPYVSDILAALTRIIEQISRNPSNPKFNHFAFESLGGLVRFICAKDPSLVNSFEDALFPPFQTILAGDVTEFMPYVFQLSSQLLEYHTGTGIPEKFQPLLPMILTPTLWEASGEWIAKDSLTFGGNCLADVVGFVLVGNVPALVKLLKAYVHKGPEYLVQSNLLNQILGVSRKLIGSKANDHLGFELLQSVFECIPTAHLTTYMKPLFLLFLTRLQTSKTSKFSKAFLLFMCFLFVVEKEGWSVDSVIGTLNEIQNGIFVGLATGVLVPEVSEVAAADDRKLCAVGLTNLLTRSEVMVSDAYAGVWSHTLLALVNLINRPIAEYVEDDDPLANVDTDDVGYHTSYSKLAAASGKKRDYAAGVADPKVYVVRQLADLALRRSGRTPTLAGLEPGVTKECMGLLRSWATAAGVSPGALGALGGQMGLA